jgi:cytochrome c oxidase cbb3-type subunit 2
MSSGTGHEKVETNTGLLLLLIILLISVGGLVQIVPLFFMKSTTVPVEGLKPYTALQLAGRDIYVREGCYVCHSQMIRPFRAETERYGHYSVAGEFVYDHPFQWGSKRTGPDLHRVGTRNISDEWHYQHLMDPRSLVPESVMPGYPWLATATFDEADGTRLQQTMKVMNMLDHTPRKPGEEGKPLYSEDEIAKAPAVIKGKTEVDALIAYLQNLGTALKDKR